MKSMICSIRGPLRRHLDSVGHSLRCLCLEIFVDNNNDRQTDRPITIPLHMRVGHIFVLYYCMMLYIIMCSLFHRPAEDI